MFISWENKKEELSLFLAQKPSCGEPKCSAVCSAAYWEKDRNSTAASNPTAQSVTGFSLCFSGTTWELCQWEGVFYFLPEARSFPSPRQPSFSLGFSNIPFGLEANCLRHAFLFLLDMWNFSDTELLLWHIIMIGCLHYIIAWYIMSSKSLFPLLFEYWTSEIN